ncbi:MAG: hypothetical protein IJ307_07245 [Bacteroidales bacterium]|nr:hypothetical protein [Bacteroidales bacterium]
MRHLAKLPTAMAVCAVAAFVFTSCIFDAPGDRFYRTLWRSSEFPLGPFSVDKLTLEFLCGQSISIEAEDTTSGTPVKTVRYGTYENDGETAVLEGLTISLQGREITFMEARRNGDTLDLLWRTEDQDFTTVMHRRSSYD